jgi:uncharacterized protein
MCALHPAFFFSGPAPKGPNGAAGGRKAAVFEVEIGAEAMGGAPPRQDQGRCRKGFVMREKLTSDLKTAMKAGDRKRVDTIRLINAALKDRDILARGEGKTVSDDDILALLQKMVKSRQESAEIYEKNNRPELAAQEKSEIEVISSYLPKQLDDAAVAEAIKAAIAETGAASMKDMGKVVGALKAKYTGQMDFAKASAAVKAALSGA